MDENEGYKITVVGNGMSFETVVNKDVAEQIIIFSVKGAYTKHVTQSAGKTLAHEHVAPSLNEQEQSSVHEQEPAQTTVEVRPEMTIREYFNEVEPKRNVDKIAAIGLYLHKYENKSSFSREDLVEWFEAAKEAVPANLPRDVSWAITAGWIAEHRKTKRSYFLTNTGISVVENKFPKEEIKKTRQKT